LGDRFYQSQLDAIGTCPGANPNKRKKRMAWTDEKRQEAIKLYTAKTPTPETSIEIVQMVASELGESVNGVRMLLNKANVYIKKAVAPTGTKKTSGTRISKEAAQSALSSAISDAGKEPDEDIISKLTGKAAVYLKDLIQSINED
jgi:hypothetical protein